MDDVTLRVRVAPDELDGGWVAECLDLPGCTSQGDTEAEASENLVDAIGSVLVVRIERGMSEHSRRHEVVSGHEFDLAV